MQHMTWQMVKRFSRAYSREWYQVHNAPFTLTHTCCLVTLDASASSHTVGQVMKSGMCMCLQSHAVWNVYLLVKLPPVQFPAD